MRLTHFLIAAATTAALSGTAAAQTTSQAPPPLAPPTYAGETQSHWIASGFVGTSFDQSGDLPAIENADDNHFTFGGQIGYLWHGVIGGEFMADFAPSVTVDALQVDGDSSINTYMANAIGSYPLGAAGNFQPYASGGIGRIALAADVFEDINDLALGTDRQNEGRLGWNMGGGLMAFASHFGVRADVRWFRSTTDNNVDTTEPAFNQFAQSLLSGLQFWRTNVGVAVRW